MAAPSGPINSEQLSVTPIATTILPGLELYASFEVRFPTQTEPGDYQFFVLPRVTDLSGNLLDQSGNGVGGGADDSLFATIDLRKLSTVDGTISADTTWSGTVHVTGDVIVASDATLTITPGTVVKFATGQYLNAQGVLLAVGTEAKPIVFTSLHDDTAGGDSNRNGAASQPQRGDWESIYIRNSSVGSRLEHVELRYAGNYYNPNDSRVLESLRLEGPDTALVDVRVREADSHGIYLVSGAFAGDISVPAGVALQLVPGAVLKFAHGQYLNIDGTLDAQGTLAQPIILTSRDDDTALGDSFGSGVAEPGDWQTLQFLANSTGNQMDYLEIRYAGNLYNPNDHRTTTAVLVSSDLVANHLTIRDSDQDGLRVANGAEVTIDGGLLRNNARHHVYVETGKLTLSRVGLFSAQTGVLIGASAAATARDSAFENLTTAVVHQANEFTSADFAQNWWGDAGGPNDPSIDDGVQNLNPAGVNIGNYVVYEPYSTVRPALPVGPVLLGFQPRRSNQPLTSLDVAFSEGMNLASFTAADITISGPQVVAIDSIEPVTDAPSTYRLHLATPLSAAGDYRISIGPAIASAASGIELDLDRDGVAGEAVDDRYVATLSMDLTGPRVV